MTSLIDKGMLLKALNESIDHYFDRSEEWKKQGMDTKAHELYACAVAIESLRSAIYSERFDVKLNEWIDAKVTRLDAIVNFLEEEKNNWEGQNPYSRGRSDSLQWVIDRIKSNNSRIGIIDRKEAEQ